MSSPEAVDMRRTKLKPEEAALIAGEVVKPSWASRNEGIHERVSFEDTLWGFEMAGGAYYKTPLRIVYVKPGSRAEQACIRMGDTVLRIQGRDTSSMTLQEAHQLVQEAGINLQIAVTSPDDLQDAHYEYQDPMMAETGLTAEQLAALERERIQKAIAKAIRCRDLEWPWVRRKFIIYRESNCFMVPSKYENKHKEQFPELPAQKIDYFFPSEPASKVKPKIKENGDVTSTVKEYETKIEENGNENMTEEEEEVEYLSEEEEEIKKTANEESFHEDDNERLQEEIAAERSNPEQNNSGENLLEEQEPENEEEIQNVMENEDEVPSNYELDKNSEHNEISSPEQNDSWDNLIEESANEKELENLIEKDDQEPSGELVENNNNDEVNSPEENYSWDDLIEEDQPANRKENSMENGDQEPSNIDLADSNPNENIIKSDDDIINSVLNGEENSNER